MVSLPGRNDPCWCGSGLKFKRCCIDRRPTWLEDAVASAGLTPDRGEVTLVVETDAGFVARRVPNASPLRRDVRTGTAAELATHDAAAVWGLPDFAFPGLRDGEGPGSRELGDGFLIVGDVGVVIQVKAREEPIHDPDRERSWLLKKVAEGFRQGDGTIRRLTRGPRSMTNLRGNSVLVDSATLQWLVVAIIDHPDPPEGVVPPAGSGKHPHIALLRRDWEFLFAQLKSSWAVVQYLRRVEDEPLEIGGEPGRYYDLALADANAQPEQLHPALVLPGHRLISAPLLPVAPVGTAGDRRAQDMFRVVMEDVAVTRLRGSSENDRLRTLSCLDRLPVGQRGDAGSFLLEAMAEVANARDGEIAWKLRSLRGSAGSVHLGFGACSRPHDAEIQEAFGCWVQLRHHDLVEITADHETITVGVLLTPRLDGRRQWDTTVCTVSGQIQFESQELRALRKLWPLPSAAAA